ncbi:MAG: YeeE/YedE family protein [bacterium]|nr:MAG: YeeE/YedE family protein [bacterium]
MIAPAYKLEFFGDGFSLIIALLIGIAFGFFIERGGLGNSRKLAAQFYLKDLTVFKVMFTAIITAMLGIFWLGWLGILDVTLIYINPTYLVPQIVGGFIFGAGFVIGGLCPGTSCVALATGKIDGIFVLGGIFFGIFIFGETYHYFYNFLYSSAAGSITLPQVLGIPWGIMVFTVVMIALLGFIGAERIEERNAIKKQGEK